MDADTLRALIARVEGAEGAARRLIQGAFRRDGERLPSEDRPRFHIPARPGFCDDLLVAEVLADHAAALRARLAEIEGGRGDG